MHVKFDPSTNTYKKIRRTAKYKCGLCHEEYSLSCNPECSINFLLYGSCPICSSINVNYYESYEYVELPAIELNIIEKYINENKYTIYINDENILKELMPPKKNEEI